jgi:hypothetical protein
MNIHRILSRVRRYRVNHGFGVHSPFAYHFITRVLRETLPYYDFERLSGASIGERDARLLYRTLVFFHPGRVCVVGRGSDVVKMALPMVTLVNSPADAEMTVWTSSADTLPTDTPLLFVRGARRNGWRTLQSRWPGGMTFTNGRVGIAVNRHGLPRQDYRLTF